MLVLDEEIYVFIFLVCGKNTPKGGDSMKRFSLSPHYLYIGILIGLVSVGFVASTRIEAATNDLFSDDFEDATLDAWDATSSPEWTNSAGGSAGAHSGTRKARVPGGDLEPVLIKTVDATGYANLTVSFWYDTSSGWDSRDSLHTEWSSDGTTWNELGVLDGAEAFTPQTEGGEEWVFVSYPLPTGANDQATLSVRFRAVISGTTDLLYLDDVVISGETDTTVTPQPTAVPTVQPTLEPTIAPTQTPQPTDVPEPTATPEPTQEPTPTSTPEPTDVPVPTVEPTEVPAPTGEPDPTETPTPTNEPEPTDQPDPTPTPDDDNDDDQPRRSLRGLLARLFAFFRMWFRFGWLW